MVFDNLTSSADWTADRRWEQQKQENTMPLWEQ